MRERTSDPLPYTQVDRAVKAKAAVLAGALNISTQHAMGSLIEFWDLNGDPREIERLIEQNKTSLVLTEEQAVRRFRIASGKEAPVDLLVELQFLEPTDGGFRVRGMSRYFKPIEKALMRRKSGQLGGLASAKARKERNGSAQPPSAPVRVALEQNSSTSEATPEGPPKHTRSKSEPSTEANVNTESREQRTESISLEEEAPTAAQKPKVPLPSKPDDPFSSGQAFFAFLQHERLAAGFATEKPPIGLSAWFSELMSELNGDHERVNATVAAYARSPYWRERNLPIQGLMSEWRKFVPRKAVAS